MYLDLIPVSSTVIPLHELTVTSHGNGTNNEEFPKMLSKEQLKWLLSKQHVNEKKDPHQLITGEF